MRKRYQAGGVRKQRGRWIGFWRVDGCRRSKVLGFVKDMTTSDAREAVGKIVAAENAKVRRDRTWQFGEFVDEVFIPYYSRKWKKSTKGSTVNRIQLHLVGAFEIRELSLLLRDELQDLVDRKVKNGLSLFDCGPFEMGSASDI